MIERKARLLIGGDGRPPPDLVLPVVLQDNGLTGGDVSRQALSRQALLVGGVGPVVVQVVPHDDREGSSSAFVLAVA